MAKSVSTRTQVPAQPAFVEVPVLTARKLAQPGRELVTTLLGFAPDVSRARAPSRAAASVTEPNWAAKIPCTAMMTAKTTSAITPIVSITAAPRSRCAVLFHRVSLRLLPRIRRCRRGEVHFGDHRGNVDVHGHRCRVHGDGGALRPPGTKLSFHGRLHLRRRLTGLKRPGPLLRRVIREQESRAIEDRL